MLRYLMGGATDEECSHIEQRFLSDNDYFEELLTLEDALIDEYVTDRMPADQRELFQANFTASQRANIGFTRSLAEGLRDPPQPRPRLKKKGAALGGIRALTRIWQALIARLQRAPVGQALAFALFAVLSASLPMFFWSSSLRRQRDDAQRQIASLQQEEEELRRRVKIAEDERQVLTKQLESVRTSRNEVRDQLTRLQEATWLRIPGLQVVRLDATNRALRESAGEAKVVEVRPGTKRVLFDVPRELPAKYVSYEVSINVRGRLVGRFSNLVPRPGARRIGVLVDADLLEYEDYRLTLFGERELQNLERIATYAFRVVK